MTTHSVLNVRAAPEWGNSELYRYYERNGLGYGTVQHLNSGYLTHCILDPKILARYLEVIEDDLEETAPEFELVFTNVYQYYGNSLIAFTNTIDDLLLQLSILIKLKVQVPMSLFSIKMAPVPLDAETYLGEKREYTQIIPETELIALTENNYIPLTQAQISLCANIGYMYYCEYAHLLKKCMEHTCMSATYYDQGSDVKAKQCKTIITFDTIPESKILDAGDLLILSNLQNLGLLHAKISLEFLKLNILLIVYSIDWNYVNARSLLATTY